jgi:hypothetical protein
MDYKPDPATGLLTEEYCDVYGVPFSVIPFRGRPVSKPEPDDTPPNLVKALPERSAMEIRFPVVEGYAFALRRNLIRCDVGAMEPLRIEPNREPTGTFVRPQVGVQVGGGMAETQSPFGFHQQDREAYYASVHLQTILFQVAQRIVEELTQAGTSGAEGRKRRVGLAPGVAAHWASRFFGAYPLGVASTAELWEEYTSGCALTITEQLLLAGRSKQAESVIQRLSTLQPDRIEIAADSAEEALAFALASLRLRRGAAVACVAAQHYSPPSAAPL